MSRKGLAILEALEVFYNLPSDIESDESSLSEAEDVMTEKSSSREHLTVKNYGLTPLRRQECVVAYYHDSCRMEFLSVQR
ncbi:hypothetical protein TNIN_72431 [Trichonephila inaurata madagascariensis]|uniref:Uncharacterized protein n=1 Tax=Trichonephila inaurata madagascariensis TaxID=2747483 RepID=A0A8X6XRC1_9ARAC|nr:hypothetical protein TNIN_72431 [Trichonephila inaurata madagascariensis]